MLPHVFPRFFHYLHWNHPTKTLPPPGSPHSDYLGFSASWKQLIWASCFWKKSHGPVENSQPPKKALTSIIKCSQWDTTFCRLEFCGKKNIGKWNLDHGLPLATCFGSSVEEMQLSVSLHYRNESCEKPMPDSKVLLPSLKKIRSTPSKPNQVQVPTHGINLHLFINFSCDSTIFLPTKIMQSHVF